MTSADEPARAGVTELVVDPAGVTGLVVDPAGVTGLVVDPAEAVPAELVRLARRCLRADGGMPQAADPVFLRRRWAAPGGARYALRAADGSLLAAVALAPTSDGVIVTGLVDPAARGRGLGARVFDHGLAAVGIGDAAAVDVGEAATPGTGRAAATGIGRVGAAAIGSAVATGIGRVGAAGVGGVAASGIDGVGAAGVGGAAAPGVIGAAVGGVGCAVTVETESATEAAGRLFASRGFTPVFAEDVMRISRLDVSAVDGSSGALSGSVPDWPQPDWPVGVTWLDWSRETAARFHAVYQAAFRERPGFPGWTAAEWIADNEDDAGFRAEWSVLAVVPGIGDAGFVTAADGWIVQVGVVPDARGRGLAAALIGETLARMAADGATEAWLNVNVDNPGAANLYRRLGFVQVGRRARFRRQ